jgi:site-specific recombinase XerD
MHARTRWFALQQACYELGQVGRPPRKAGPAAHRPAELAARIRQPEIRREVVRYVRTIASTLRPGSVYARTKAVLVFVDYLAEHHPRVHRLDQLERAAHVEPFLAWDRHRPWRGSNGRGRTVSLVQFHHDVVDLRVFFEDLACWGWASAPSARLLFASDIPRLPEPVPRALPPTADRALMAAVAGLDDPLACTALQVLRVTGMRVGELLDLELDCLVDFASHGTWLRVPLGKLASERMVPLDEHTLAVLDDWMAQRGQQRALPHPRLERPADFLFCQRGRRPTAFRLRRALDEAAQTAGLRRPDGTPLHVTPYQLHLRDQSDQRRDLAARPDGPHGPRHPRDDPALRQARRTHRPCPWGAQLRPRSARVFTPTTPSDRSEAPSQPVAPPGPHHHPAHRCGQPDHHAELGTAFDRPTPCSPVLPMRSGSPTLPAPTPLLA